MNKVVSQINESHTFDLKLKGFKVYPIETSVHPLPSYTRRDFYKICLVTGNSVINYADRGIILDGTYLFFGNPHIPYSSELLSTKLTGYACLFTEEFLKSNDRSESLQESPFFKIGGDPVFVLTETQKKYIADIFERMLVEQEADYTFKSDLIRNYINLMIHEALKFQPPDNFHKHHNASSRIASLFLNHLEKQFPIDSIEQSLKLKTAQDYANVLSVHVNHLNRAVMEITAKTTSTHIAERIISEAKALLHYTDWSIAEVAYALGFEYPTHFNNYFKRHTGNTPRSFRVETF
jgi:AraC family transcriptional regulator, transcriptional activator of pobA